MSRRLWGRLRFLGLWPREFESHPCHLVVRSLYSSIHPPFGCEARRDLVKCRLAPLQCKLLVNAGPPHLPHTSSRRSALVNAMGSSNKSCRFCSLININHSPRCGFQTAIDTALESAEADIFRATSTSFGKSCSGEWLASNNELEPARLIT